jgi:hypothetical protein
MRAWRQCLCNCLGVDRTLDKLDVEVRKVTVALRGRLPDLPGDVIEKAVRDGFAHFQGARIRDFVGVLVERSAREQLTKPG